DCDDLWNQVKPLYEELHAYTRYKLRESRYPQLNLEDAIPASVLGKKHVGSKLGRTERFTYAFPNATILISRTDSSRTWRDKGHHGLLNMSVAYGPKAMLVKPTDKQVVCHAGAWDFSNDDFRIKMCTTISQSDFLTAGHELGHIQYFMSYKHLPYMFRSGANPGDLISISMRTPKHMIRTGLVNEKEARVSKESTLNYLMQVSLQKVPFLPFAYLIDAYRWKIFDGSISRKDLTYEWTKIRSDYQGVIPPVVRTELDFDAAAKYHLPNDVPYISYFVSHMLQFQLYKALCETAKEYPAQHLHQNKDVGAQLQKLLKAGSSKNWQTILEETIGQSKMNASALLEFFAPIYDFLKEYRAKMNYPIGWPKKTFENMVHRG
ncbi:Angiotensin-converting enzyme, partial [Orchesella cincta]